MNEDYAIVVGIDSYAKMADDSGFPALSSALKDANAFVQWLVKPDCGGIENDPTPFKRRIITIFSPTVINNQLPSLVEARPVKEQIDEALTEFGFKAAQGRIGRRLYFYFSGHGLGLSSSDVAMMMANSVKSMLSNNISLRTYREYMQERYLFDEVVFIADCCRSRETTPVESGKPVFETAKDAELPPMKDVAILAAEYSKPSFAVSDGHGLLTTALIEGLNGHPGALDQKGRVTSNTLNNFLPKRIEALAKQNLVKQSPEMDLFPKKAEIIFCKPRIKVKIQIIAADFLKGSSLIVCDGENNELFRSEAAAATKESPWQVELFDSLAPYSIKITTFGNPIIFELSKVKEKGNVLQVP